MSRWRAVAWCLAAFVLHGCRHELNLEPSAPADDAGPYTAERDAGIDDDSTRSDGGRELPYLDDAGPHDRPAFPYRWRKNGPTQPVGLGSASFTLSCVDARTGDEVVGCDFLCRHEGAPAPVYSCEPEMKGEPCVGMFGGVGDEGPNRVCVTVLQPESDETAYAESERTDCWEFEGQPFPYTVPRPTFDPRSTRLDVQLPCEWADSRRAIEGVTPRCVLECSVDGEPYSYCSSHYVRDDITPGEHELRVKISAALPKVTADAEWYVGGPVSFPFTIRDDAQPPVELPVLPPMLSELELSHFSLLVEPYVRYAQACVDASPGEARAAFITYASAALQRGVELDPDLLATCLNQLEYVNAHPDFDRCVDVMLIGDDLSVHDALLPARLPFDCLMLDATPPTLTGHCFTHAECQAGVCQPLAYGSPLGVCFSSDVGEGSLCGAAACDIGEYCAGTCKKRRPEGDKCLADFECWHGASCSNGRCVRTRCAGETCASNEQCQSARCVERRCQ